MRLNLSSSEGSRVFLINHRLLSFRKGWRAETRFGSQAQREEALICSDKGCPLKMWKGSPIVLGREEEPEAPLSSGFSSQCLTTVFSLLQSPRPQNVSDSSWERKMTAQHLLSSSRNSMSCWLWMDRRWNGRRQPGETWLDRVSAALAWGKQAESKWMGLGCCLSSFSIRWLTRVMLHQRNGCSLCPLSLYVDVDAWRLFFTAGACFTNKGSRNLTFVDKGVNLNLHTI